MRDYLYRPEPGAGVSPDGRYSPAERAVVVHNVLHVLCLTVTAMTCLASCANTPTPGLSSAARGAGSSGGMIVQVRPIRNATTRCAARLLQGTR